jgi:hypothetical protein
VERIGELAASDPEREQVGELIEAWWRRHGEAPTYRINLHPEVLQIVAGKEGAAARHDLSRQPRRCAARRVLVRATKGSDSALDCSNLQAKTDYLENRGVNLFCASKPARGIEWHRVGLAVFQGVISTRLDAVCCPLHQKNFWEQ